MVRPAGRARNQRPPTMVLLEPTSHLAPEAFFPRGQPYPEVASFGPNRDLKEKSLATLGEQR